MNEFEDWLNSLEVQTLTDELKRDIIEKAQEDFDKALVPEDVDSKDPWAWVKTEYCALFKAKNPDKGGKIKESVVRMKTMFRARPEIRKEDVILTVKLYLSQTDSRFIRYPHYFLKKGQGANAIYEFDDWYDKYLEAKSKGAGRTSSSNTMQ
jgi:hypothetical protein